MDPELRHQLARLARRHHGIVTREELLDLGCTAHAIDWALGTAQLVALFPGVYRVAGAPDTWHGRALAAHRRVDRQLRRRAGAEEAPPVVAMGAAAAAHLHGLPGHGRAPELTVVTSRRCRSTSVRVQTCASLTSADVVEILSLPVTSLAWSTVETAGRQPREARRDLLAHVVGTGRLRHGQLVGAAHRADVAGRRAVLEDLRAMAGPVDHYRSGTEKALVTACTEAGLPRPLVNHPTTTRAGTTFELDLAWPDVLLDVEVDGPHHLLPSQRRTDRLRDRQLRADGWEVARFPVEEIDDAADLARRIGALLERR